MKKITLTTIIVFFTILSHAQWQQLGSNILGDSPLDEFGEAVSMDDTGNIIAIGARLNDMAGDNYGMVKVFELINDIWQQKGSDLLGQTFPSIGEKFGWDLDLNADGTRLVVAAPFFVNGTTIPGVVRVYEFDGLDWAQLGSNIEGENDADLSGWSVAINNDGSRVIIGSVGNSDNGIGSGQARIYDFNGSIWIKIGNDIEGETAYLTGGSGVDINGSGNRVAVGYAEQNCPSCDPGAGKVRIFELVSGNWAQLGNDVLGEAEGDDFARELSLNDNGDRIAIGARIHSGNELFSGQARVFEFQNNNWSQLGASIEGIEGEALGTSVSLNNIGNIVAVGGRANNPTDLQKGIVRVFRLSNGSWHQFDDSIYGDANEDMSGSGVDISSAGNRVVIGAPFNDAGGNNSGQARVFENDAVLSNVDIKLENVAMLYPNPNNGRFSLNFSEEIEVTKIDVVDGLGKLIYSESNIPSGNIEIDHNFSTGVYFVNVSSKDSEATLKMIVD